MHFSSFPETYKRNVQNKLKRHGEFAHEDDAEVALYRKIAEDFKDNIVDTVVLINEAVRAGKRVLVEGANAALLDLDFGTYPFVTSSNCTIGGVCTGLGLPPRALGHIAGVVKAYTTRVGAGPFPTELLDETGNFLQEEGREFGTTTGRRRRCGWFDAPVCQYSAMINGYTHLNITKLDVLSKLPSLKLCVAYLIDGKRIASMPASIEDLARVHCEYIDMPGWGCPIDGCRSWDDMPKNAKDYVLKIEELVGVKVRWIGVGPGREAMIDRGE